LENWKKFLRDKRIWFKNIVQKRCVGRDVSKNPEERASGSHSGRSRSANKVQ